MIANPEYSVEIIVLIKYKGEYSWYVSEKEYWVLNYYRWGEGFGSTLEKIEIDPIRNEIEVLKVNNWPEFKARMSKYEVSTNELTELIKTNFPITSWDEKGELFPSLFIDFDQKNLFSLFSETLAFEEYIPDEWTGKYENFYPLIPIREKYWIIDSIDFFPTT